MARRIALSFCAIFALFCFSRGWFQPSLLLSGCLLLTIPVFALLLRREMIPFGNRRWISYLSVVFDSFPYIGIFVATMVGINLSLDLPNWLNTNDAALNKVLGNQAVGVAIGALTLAIFDPLKTGSGDWSAASVYRRIVRGFVASQSVGPRGDTLTFHAIYSDIVPDHADSAVPRNIHGWSFHDRVKRSQIISIYWSRDTNPKV